MREDMFKVVVERPRWGSRHCDSPKLRHTDRNVSQIGHKRHVCETQGWGKSLNENLAPLRRYLHKQRGRKWDDVFSEICQHLDTGSTVKMHIREHLEDFIMVNIHIDAQGNWLGQGRWGGAIPLDATWGWPDLYVDPFDGRIRETEALRGKKKIPRKRWRYGVSPYDEGPHSDFRRVAKDRVLWLRKGIWFELCLDRDPSCSDDQLRHELLNASWREHERWRVASVKQLSSKQLKANGLSNSPTDV